MHVVACHFSGDRFLQFDIESTRNIYAVKLILERDCKYPLACQRLLLGATELSDDTVLKNLDICQDGAASLILVCLISLENVSQDLMSNDCEKQFAALQTLAMLGSRSGPAGVDVLCTYLLRQDEDCLSGEFGLQTLGDIADHGSSRAIETLLTMITDMPGAGLLISSEVEVTIQILTQLTPKGNEQVVTEMISFLLRDFMEGPNRETGPHREAAKALALLADSGDERAIAALRPHLLDEDDLLRRSTLHALLTLLEQTDMRAKTFFMQGINDNDERVRLVALEHAVRVASKADSHAILSIADRLADWDCCVRHAALNALTEIVDKDDESIISKVISHLSHSDSAVRLTALEAISEVATPGHRVALSAAISRRNDFNYSLKRAATEAVLHLNMGSTWAWKEFLQ